MEYSRLGTALEGCGTLRVGRCTGSHGFPQEPVAAAAMANIVQWQDLFIVVDDGYVPISEYERLEPLVVKQAKSCRNGLGCLVIIPELAVLPPAAVRQHLKRMLRRLPMRALGYLVEGTGFRAAAVRAVLISLGVFQSEGYPTKVLTSLEEAVKWLLSAPSGRSDVRAAMRVINDSVRPIR